MSAMRAPYNSKVKRAVDSTVVVCHSAVVLGSKHNALDSLVGRPIPDGREEFMKSVLMPEIGLPSPVVFRKNPCSAGWGSLCRAPSSIIWNSKYAPSLPYDYLSNVAQGKEMVIGI